VYLICYLSPANTSLLLVCASHAAAAAFNSIYALSGIM
jgi:hypothetical protein